MVSPGEAIGLVVFVAIQTALAAVSTRFFRVLVVTRLATTLLVLLAVPALLLATTFVLSGALVLGFDLQDRYLAVLVAIVVPFVLGVTVDLVWVASPDEVAAELEG